MPGPVVHIEQLNMPIRKAQHFRLKNKFYNFLTSVYERNEHTPIFLTNELVEALCIHMIMISPFRVFKEILSVLMQSYDARFIAENK